MDELIESTTIMDSYINSTALYSSPMANLEMSSTTEISLGLGESLNKTLQTIISTKDIVSIYVDALLLIPCATSWYIKSNQYISKVLLLIATCVNIEMRKCIQRCKKYFA
jgi:hypothetical protein